MSLLKNAGSFVTGHFKASEIPETQTGYTLGHGPAANQTEQDNNISYFKKYEQMERDVEKYDREVDRLIKERSDAVIKHQRHLDRLDTQLEKAQWDLRTAEDNIVQRVENGLKKRYDVHIARKPPPSPEELDDHVFETPPQLPSEEE